jgi:hypothetical protein
VPRGGLAAGFYTAKGAIYARSSTRDSTVRLAIMKGYHEVIPEIKKRAPATKRRGAETDVPNKRNRTLPKDPDERKLEEGLEESMAGA